MLVDLLVKSFAQDYGILARRWRWAFIFSFMEPKVDPIKKVKPGPINDKRAARLVIRPEKDGGSEYPLEAFHDAVISFTVFEEMEEIEHFGGGAESDNAAALTDGYGGHPDRYEPVLAVRKAELRMADDLKEEFPVAPCVR
jgi:hypothetical protein